jgi:hypothetical protein
MFLRGEGDEGGDIVDLGEVLPACFPVWVRIELRNLGPMASGLPKS